MKPAVYITYTILHMIFTLIRSVTRINVQHAIPCNTQLSLLPSTIWQALCIYITILQFIVYINHYICNAIVQYIHTNKSLSDNINNHNRSINRGLIGNITYIYKQFNLTYLVSTGDTIRYIYQHGTYTYNTTSTNDKLSINTNTQHKSTSNNNVFDTVAKQYKNYVDIATSPVLELHQPSNNKLSKSTSMGQFTSTPSSINDTVTSNNNIVQQRQQSSTNIISVHDPINIDPMKLCNHQSRCDCRISNTNSTTNDTPFKQPRIITRDESTRSNSGFVSPAPIHSRPASIDNNEINEQLNSLLIGAISNKSSNNNINNNKFTPSKLINSTHQSPVLSRIGSYANSNRSSYISHSGAFSTTQLVKEILNNSTATTSIHSQHKHDRQSSSVTSERAQ